MASMKLPDRITVDPEIMMGKPCVRGTRIPVYVLLQKMAAGETEAELLSVYPQLSKVDSILAGWHSRCYLASAWPPTEARIQSILVNGFSTPRSKSLRATRERYRVRGTAA